MNGARIPVVHNRAFGHVGLFAGAPRPADRQMLGEPPGPTISSTELDYRNSLTYYQGVQKNYSELARLMGDRDANRALEEAKASYEKSLKEWTAQQPTRL